MIPKIFLTKFNIQQKTTNMNNENLAETKKTKPTFQVDSQTDKKAGYDTTKCFW